MEGMRPMMEGMRPMMEGMRSMDMGMPVPDGMGPEGVNPGGDETMADGIMPFPSAGLPPGKRPTGTAHGQLCTAEKAITRRHPATNVDECGIRGRFPPSWRRDICGSRHGWNSRNSHSPRYYRAGCQRTIRSFGTAQ